MTLHEAIEMILQETGRPMSPGEIADIVNKRNLYSRKDGLPVSAVQVDARVKNYKNLFVQDEEKIKLLNNDTVSLKLEKLKKEVRDILAKDKREDSIKFNDSGVLIDILEDLNGF